MTATATIPAMDGRDASTGGGTSVDGHIQRTYGIPPPRGLLLAGVWLMACGCAAWSLDRGIVQSAAILVGSTIGICLFLWGVALWARGARLARAIARAGPSPWEAKGLWNARATTLAGPLGPRDGARPIDARTDRLAVGAVALVLVAVAPDYVWRGAVVAAYLVCDQLVRPRNRVAARVAFGSFPMLLGDRARFSVTFARRSPAETFETVLLTLRCIEETPRLLGAVWPSTRCVLAIPPVSSSRAPADDGPFEVEFEVPADAPGTDLLRRPATYWELVVEAESPSWFYEQAFQVPVYARAPVTR